MERTGRPRRRTPVRRARVLAPPVLTGLLLVLTACGDATSGPPDDSATAVAGWTRQAVSGTAGSDHPAVLVSDDAAGVLVALVSDDGVLQSHASPDGRALVEGEPLRTGLEAFGLSGATAHDGSWFAMGSGGIGQVDGDEGYLGEPHAFRSPDGLSWTPVELSGIDAPVDVNGLVALDGTLVASGGHRPAGSGSEGFRAAVWTSPDGATWTEAELPGAATGESSAADVVVTGDRLLVAGSVDRSAVLWASEDAGATWSTLGVPALRPGTTIGGLAATEAAVVLSVQGAGAAVLRSTDQGRTWAEAARPLPAASQEADFPADVQAGGGRFFASTSVYRDAFSTPGLCYASIEVCRQDSVVTLWTSEDGDRWSRVDTSGVGGGEDGEVDRAVGTPDGGVLALQAATADGAVVSAWPAGPPLPMGEEPLTETVDLVTVPRAGPEPGVRYHAPLYVHCGMDHLFLGDSVWRRTDDGAGVETGGGDEPPADWPVAQQTVFGYATLVEPDVVEYSLEDGEVVATYAPVARAPGCD
ncbi:MAG: hypothetical protein JWN84_2918 [Nocardioides sp.]|nr:hypothetical protein [Nocardioides sp.]